ncbi:protein of unknown function (DUF4395) [Streptoalloteichus tenebrarius]|uniref:DUF4395 domain-containing protein n=1 Tax=Streptoalloteichus tenebrarius (strain ATCC 17920 / DSM 40477 / JCM 4838 / CBS 697.72 / NBRC 16177 / NCIMB 11028 / NRRL B-12390 / A12253. 1 / ISP 5477) TaxID=1933 RepID=A0ABT1HV24_STRSD|nr:DUF4395 domain-containing protein [Streptoalloteichus tenebrarius]MCP2259383.1 protein of unknown function (DUF4395) [Streptoalloteichus tenebrarius]BFF02324.1 DUF4395 domain-containing protein [Streptoalloteichus tenebrarius]
MSAHPPSDPTAPTPPGETGPAGRRNRAVDPRGPRFTAGVTSVVLALVLVTGSWRLLAAQMLIFALCAFVGLRLNPYGYVFRKAVLPRLRPTEEREDPSPLRFAQGVGFAFSLVGVVGYASGFTTLGVVATAAALVAALLNAVFGFCLGCEAYLLLRRLGPAAHRHQTS